METRIATDIEQSQNYLYCNNVRTKRCKNRVEGEPKTKEYGLTLASQGYYKN